MLEFKEQVAIALSKASGIHVDARSLTVPPNPELGDLSSSVAFQLTGNPKENAEKIAKKIKPSGLIAKVETKGPYINFFLNWNEFNKLVITSALKPGYGKNQNHKGKTAMVEYSQPNPNKPQHVGHLRNNLLGIAISNILEANGWKVIRANLINDRGIHICKAMLGYLKWGNGKEPDEKPDHFVAKFYQRFVKEEAKNPELTKEAQEMLRKWEAGDPEVRKLWKKIVKWAYEGWKETYSLIGAKFDVWFYESEIYQDGKKIIEEGLRKGVLKKAKDGSVYAELEPELPNKTVLRSDGTAIYITNDLALAKKKFEMYNLDKSIYVIGSAQNTYMKQLFKILSLLGFEWADKCYHLSYGMVYLPEGKMSSRLGRMIYADDLLAEVIELAEEEARKKGISKDIKETAKHVGLAAVKFNFLKVNHKRDILFEKEKAVSFDGDTGPYLQYAHARCNQILEKLEVYGKTKKADYSLLNTTYEENLIKELGKFPNVVLECGENFETHTLANYLLELAHTFSEFYDNCPVIKAEGSLQAARADLVKATKNVLATGLELLGIKPLDKM